MAEQSKMLKLSVSPLSCLKHRLAGVLDSGIFQNVSIVLGGNAIVRGIGFFTTWILVRHLSPGEYGVFSVLDMVAGISVGLLTTGFNWSMIKSVAAYSDDPPKAWTIARIVLKVEIIYGLILSFGLYLGADRLAQRFLKKPELTPFIRLCCIGVLGTILLGYRNSIFQALKQFKRDAAFAVGNSAIYFIIIVLLLSTKYFNIRVISIAYVSLPLIISGLAIFMLRNAFSIGRGSYSHDLLRAMGAGYVWLLCYTLCLWFSAQFHLMILTRYFPLQEVGLYGFAYKIYGISLIFTNAINVVLLPTFSGIKDRTSLRKSFLKIIKATTGISLCFLLTIPFLGSFVQLFAGTRYAGATNMLQILIFGAATSTVLSSPVNVLFALDRFKLIAIGGIGMVAINLMGHLLITRSFGGIGAAFVQVLSYLVLNVFLTLHAFKETYSSNEAST